MPATISRLLMCFGVLTGSVIVYLMVFVSYINNRDEFIAFTVSGTISCLSFAAGWTMVWRSAVSWNTHRIILTLLAVPGGLIPSALAYFVGETLAQYSNGAFGIFLATLTWTATWLTGTAILWRETPKERGERLQRLGIHAVACPDCGYNLTGLKEAKCPECGEAYTLDQLYASIAEQRSELGGE